MAKKMQHCFNCGEELGIYDRYPGDKDTCGKPECNREAAYEEQAERADAAWSAQQDNYDRYR